MMSRFRCPVITNANALSMMARCLARDQRPFDAMRANSPGNRNLGSFRGLPVSVPGVAIVSVAIRSPYLN